MTINLNHSKPVYLYKYRQLNDSSREWTRDIILNSQLYFASPDSFNDPFDCFVEPTFEASDEIITKHWQKALSMQLVRYTPFAAEFTNLVMKGAIDPFEEVTNLIEQGKLDINLRTLHLSLERQIEKAKTPEGQQEIVQQQLSSNAGLGVLSLSEDPAHILMWSHYADDHKGLCLQFKAYPGTSPLGSSNLASARVVKYSVDHPDISLYDPDERKWSESLLFTKAHPWKYEREWRVMDPEGPGVKPYPEELLTGIILGCRMEDKEKADVIEWAKERSKPINIYVAEQRRRSFQLDIGPLQQEGSPSLPYTFNSDESGLWVEFKIGNAFPKDDIVARYVVGLSIILNDQALAYNRNVQLSKPEYENIKGGERFYFFRLAASQYREAAKFIDDAYSNQEIVDFIEGLPNVVQDMYETVRVTFSPFKGSWVERITKPIRDSFFHYPTIDSEELGKAMENLAEYQSGVEYEENVDLGHRMIYADDVMANITGEYMKDLEKDMADIADAVGNLVNYAEGAITIYMERLPEGTIVFNR